MTKVMEKPSASTLAEVARLPETTPVQEKGQAVQSTREKAQSCVNAQGNEREFLNGHGTEEMARVAREHLRNITSGKRMEDQHIEVNVDTECGHHWYAI